MTTATITPTATGLQCWACGATDIPPAELTEGSICWPCEHGYRRTLAEAADRLTDTGRITCGAGCEPCRWSAYWRCGIEAGRGTGGDYWLLTAEADTYANAR